MARIVRSAQLSCTYWPSQRHGMASVFIHTEHNVLAECSVIPDASFISGKQKSFIEKNVSWAISSPSLHKIIGQEAYAKVSVHHFIFNHFLKWPIRAILGDSLRSLVVAWDGVPRNAFFLFFTFLNDCQVCHSQPLNVMEWLLRNNLDVFKFFCLNNLQ